MRIDFNRIGRITAGQSAGRFIKIVPYNVGPPPSAFDLYLHETLLTERASPLRVENKAALEALFTERGWQVEWI